MLHHDENRYSQVRRAVVELSRVANFVLPNFVKRLSECNTCDTADARALLLHVIRFNQLHVLGRDVGAARWQRDDWSKVVRVVHACDLAAEAEDADDGEDDAEDDVEDDEFELTRMDFQVAKMKMVRAVLEVWDEWDATIDDIDGVTRTHLEAFDRDLSRFAEATQLSELSDRIDEKADELYTKLAAKFMQGMEMGHELYVLPKRSSASVAEALEGPKRLFDGILRRAQTKLSDAPSEAEAESWTTHKEEMAQLRDIIFSDATNREERINALLAFWTEWYTNNAEHLDVREAEERGKSVAAVIRATNLSIASEPLQRAISMAIERQPSIENLVAASTSSSIPTLRAAMETARAVGAEASHPGLWRTARSRLQTLQEQKVDESRRRARDDPKDENISALQADIEAAVLPETSVVLRGARALLETLQRRRAHGGGLSTGNGKRKWRPHSVLHSRK